MKKRLLKKLSAGFLSVLCTVSMFTTSMSGAITASAASVSVGTPELVISSRSTSAVKMKWSKVSNATGYKVYRYNDSKDTWSLLTTIESTGKSSYSYTDSISKTKQVKYRMRAYYKTSSGSTIWSDYSDAKTVRAYFELPLIGATGWCAIKMNLYKSASTSSTVLKSLAQGKVFRIMGGTDGYWKIRVAYDDATYTGYVKEEDCMINLPDILPSIQYKITNAYSSVLKSSGKSISGITGEKLYSAGTVSSKGKVTNNRLGTTEYLVPVMFTTAKKIAIAQYNAQRAGVCLKIYDSYRPYSVTTKSYKALLSLYNSNSTVRDNINYSTGTSGTKYYWGTSWFLASGTSAHNFGAAIDVTLCKKTSDGTYEELSMPTSMGELSTKAIKYYCSSVTHKAANYSKEMLASTNAQLLDAIFNGYTFTYKGTKYSFTDTDMSTLASEWWHFQDDSALSKMRSKTSNTGFNFQVTACKSVV